MNKYIAIIIVAAVALVGLYFTLGKAPQTAVLPASNQLGKETILSADRMNYEFGTISMQDGKVSTRFRVKNNAESDLRIDSVVTSCMCTVAYVESEEGRVGPYGMPGHGNTVPKANITLKPGEEFTVEAVFDPAAHGPAGIGFAERYIYLVDENGAAFKLKITADVTL